MTKKRVMLVEDHEPYRIGLRTELMKHPDLEVVAEADRVQIAVEKALEVRPDVLVLDLEIPGNDESEDGTTVAAALGRAGARIPILVLSVSKSEGDVLSMLAEGVAGYFLKTEPLNSIIEAIRAVACGERGWLSRAITDQITKSPRCGQDLTQRELEVLKLLAFSNEEIAKSLGRTVGTVKKHVGSILAKLGVPSRAAAINLAWQRGLFSKRAK